MRRLIRNVRPLASRGSALLLALGGIVLPSRAVAIDVVVGNGQPASCTEAAFASAVGDYRTGVVASGGTITFNCGGPATITITTQKVFQNHLNVGLVYTIDGGGNITLDGGGAANGANRILFHTTGTLNLRNITFRGGWAQTAPGADPDDASGGAVRSDANLSFAGAAPVHLNLTNVTFINNGTNLTVTPTPPFSPFDYGGGAVFTRFGIVNITSCTFAGNGANNTAGGALHVRSSTVTIMASSFNANASTGGGMGGAIHVDGLSPTPSAVGGTLQIGGTTFTNNTTRNQGGAIFVFQYAAKSESATLDSVSVTGNQVTDSSGTFLKTTAYGGGVAFDSGNVTIVSSTFANNHVHSNGGIAIGGGVSIGQIGQATISNSTISNNRADSGVETSAGGGLVVSLANGSPPFVVRHSTIAFNVSDQQGGGIHAEPNTGTLNNTIVAHNDALHPGGFDQCTNQLNDGGGVMEFPQNNPSPCVNGVTLADPDLAALASNGGPTQTHMLQAGSPAIDAGTCVLPTDQRGIPRPQGPACDLGAVEVFVPPVPSDFFTVTPCRLFDTRNSGPPLACNVNHVFTVTGGSCGIPLGARAISANVTVTQPSAPGFVNVFPAGVPTPLTSVVNYAAGATRANNAMIRLNEAGQIAVRCAPSGSAHVLIDVNGYFQ